MANRLLYLARHGEYEAAQAAEPEDGELTEIGRQQSKLLGNRLRGIPFSAVHHSPWTRAVQTAELVAEHLPGVPLRPSDLLQECIPAVPDRHRLTPSQAEFLRPAPEGSVRRRSCPGGRSHPGLCRAGHRRPARTHHQPRQPDQLVRGPGPRRAGPGMAANARLQLRADGNPVLPASHHADQLQRHGPSAPVDARHRLPTRSAYLTGQRQETSAHPRSTWGHTGATVDTTSTDNTGEQRSARRVQKLVHAACR
jgi:hypothetical protein